MVLPCRALPDAGNRRKNRTHARRAADNDADNDADNNADKKASCHSTRRLDFTSFFTMVNEFALSRWRGSSACRARQAPSADPIHEKRGETHVQHESGTG
ncbi:hypothetical protein EN871_02220 [bacterium M00.F.Ca.ET.228.01.1.1]|nr:hypothetical protein EN871_02220 [bacterium M00.F.Ca.ET.228.01.1.1]TGS05442.1 hypothetical protein EN834_02220 [bacterium M00.F.Ca.ET.191.01.1.1]TGU10378.1 hypothetical protein EN798_02220 [bacterium M00.F.Ca.ET.155.01.1.1]